MQAFSNVALPDTYGGTSSEFYSNKGVSCFIGIWNNAAAFEILYRDPNRTSEPVQSPEQASGPGTFLIEGAAGIRMRNNVAGQVARVFVTIFEPTDPRIVGFNPITATITATGAVSAGGIVSDLAFQAFAAPVAISATTEATATTVVTAPAVTTDGAQYIDVEVFVPSLTAGAAGSPTLTGVLYEDGASIGQIFVYSVDNTARRASVLAKWGKRQPSAAAHTYSLRAFTNSANGSASAGAGGSGNLIPGYIRVLSA